MILPSVDYFEYYNTEHGTQNKYLSFNADMSSTMSGYYIQSDGFTLSEAVTVLKSHKPERETQNAELLF